MLLHSKMKALFDMIVRSVGTAFTIPPRLESRRFRFVRTQAKGSVTDHVPSRPCRREIVAVSISEVAIELHEVIRYGTIGIIRRKAHVKLRFQCFKRLALRANLEIRNITRLICRHFLKRIDPTL